MTDIVPPDSDWFPVRITAVGTGLFAGQYTFQEVWTIPAGVIADRVGGRVNSANDPAYAIDGATFAVTAAGSAVQVMARRSPGSGGTTWELQVVGGDGGTTVYADEGTLGVGAGYTLLEAGTRTVPRGDYLAISTFGVRFDGAGLMDGYFALGVWDASLSTPPATYYVRTTPHRVTTVGGSGGGAGGQFETITLNQGFYGNSQVLYGLGSSIKIGLFYKNVFGVGTILPFNHSLSLIPCSLT